MLRRYCFSEIIKIDVLRMHVTFIRQAAQSENTALKKCLEGLKIKSNNGRRKRPLFSSQKKVLDNHFSSISSQAKSVSLEHKNFGGKHIKFISSSSENDDNADYECEDDDNIDCESEDDKDEYDRESPSSQKRNKSDQASTCPYPSAAEEMRRFGLKSEMDGSLGCNEGGGPSKRKINYENISCSVSRPHKVPKSDKVDLKLQSDNHKKGSSNQNEVDFSLLNDSMRMFITTWKEACQENNVAEVFERMLQFYKAKKRKQMREMFSSFPCIGLLNVAVSSIKGGTWDSMYDTFQTFNQKVEGNTASEKDTDYVSIEVEPVVKGSQAVADQILKQEHDVTAEDILQKVSAYFEMDDGFLCNTNQSLEKKFIFLRRLCKCEFWLIDQLCLKNFESLGYGEFLMFLEKYFCKLPPALQNYFTVNMSEKVSWGAHLLFDQLVVLLSQAPDSLWENENKIKQRISELLMRQFPSVCFKLVESGSIKDFGDTVKANKNNSISNCILFSSSLFRMNYNGDMQAHHDGGLLEAACVRTDAGHGAGIGTVTSKNAIEILLKAPMLTDLSSWSHWDLIFAPSLGPLVGWLLNEVNNKELLCLVTNSGKVIRLDQSATMDSFLEAALQRSPFQTALKLLSLFSLYGGEKNIPSSLLKFHAQKAFEVIVTSSAEMELNDDQNDFMNGKPWCRRHMFDKITTSCLSRKLQTNGISDDKAVTTASRFFINCLSHLPMEFCSFAADVLLSGFRAVVKYASSAILTECKQVEQRLMLHEVGISLGIVEWVNDYHAFSSLVNTDLIMSSGSLCSEAANSESPVGITHKRDGLNKVCFSESEMMVSDDVGWHDEEHRGVCCMVNNAETSGDNTRLVSSETNKDSDPVMVIESIRREEFGLDPSLSVMESSMLKKQHARLGRALCCLSEELYSQNSHFLLELVQNADDNMYPGDVEPTLTFILQDGGIIVLNNEVGFSSENIKALCDVGNSTKRGSTAGYIGKKGIGFKSVFRVTDAPEIHSNGFHIKFDISEGQIGFVLPTVVPACNINVFSQLVCLDTDKKDDKYWNTCIVLPFRSQLSKSFAMKNIISMFSDLHPSLLLFLHRLQCIKFRNMINNSLVMMRKEVVGDGIVKVSHGKEKMTWFVVSQKLQAGDIRPDMPMTEISVAFTLQESDNGDYIPLLEQQPVFAFLPLRTYGLKFILQGDFVLPSSREEVDVDSPWNQWLLSEFPGLFVSAERSFCRIPCLRENPGKAITTFMSFVPLVGDVHGFFSSLPRMIISKLRLSNCLLVEGNNSEWVAPCKVLRNWTEEARALLPDSLLREHLGLGFLSKDIVLPDSLARALGIEEYGPKILLQVISSLCCTENGLKSVGLGWLSSWLNAIYLMSYSPGQTSLNCGTESDLIVNLRKIAFIPLLDGGYGSIDEGTIWLQSDAINTGFDSENGPEAFPKLYSKLRSVSPALFSAAVIADNDMSSFEAYRAENLTRMLYKIGVQQLSAHEIVNVHVLPAISDYKNTLRDNDLMTEYLSFAMFHLQSSCPNCCIDREHIISELYNKAFILTNYGYKRSVEVSLHFNKGFGNPIDVNKLINGIDVEWHEVDNTYLRHTITKTVSSGLLKWRKFFQELGVTDFVQIEKVEKSGVGTSNVVSDMLMDKDLITRALTFKDWESQELIHLLSEISSCGQHRNCKYLLEVLDTLWDDYFSDKVTGYCHSNSTGETRPFKSSLVSTLQDAQWIVSSMDEKLHYPKDLFHECDAVFSILGINAPYAVPKVKSLKLVNDIGLKNQVTLDDILSVLQVWTRCEAPFRASISQMSKFYTFIWNEMTTSEQKITKVLHSGAFIFIPCQSGSTLEGVVPGVFLSPEEVYWHDSIGSVDLQEKVMHYPRGPDVADLPFSRMLSNIYPGLHDFFVNVCGVPEIPSFRGYLKILLQLSCVALPSQAASTVFQVFLKWTDGLKSGLLSSEDFEYLKENLLKMECTVLPTQLDKWVSLNSYFGLVCWCDDEKLKNEFKHFDGIDFLYFGELSEDEKGILQANVSVLLQRLGVPALSEVVTHEAVYYGPADSSFKASLVNWALPYAQRYIYNVHPEKYFQFKESGFENLRCLRIIMVQELFYRNVIKSPYVVSDKQFKCSCLLQDNVLYTMLESDTHSMFMELSRLLVGGTPELHLANFIHMIATMAESGSTEEQTEYFICNSQKIPKLPDEESTWTLPSLPSSTKNDVTINCVSAMTDEPYPTVSERKPGSNSNWPPVNWKTAPGFSLAHANGMRTQARSRMQNRRDDAEEIVAQTNYTDHIEMDADLTTEDDPEAIATAVILQDSETFGDHFDCANPVVPSRRNATRRNVAFDSADLVTRFDIQNSGSFESSERDQLLLGSIDGQQARLTGREGEFVAFKYFAKKLGEASVKWVNEANETGLPYDISIGELEKSREYIEVKATKSARKNWFTISVKEWQFAIEKGESFSIAHVLLGNDKTRVTKYKNPVKLCKLGKLQLAVVMPNQ